VTSSSPKRAREQAVVATDACHDLALGLLAEKLLGVGHDAPPAEGKTASRAEARIGREGLPQLAQPRVRGGAGVGGGGVAARAFVAGRWRAGVLRIPAREGAWSQGSGRIDDGHLSELEHVSLDELALALTR